MEISTIYFECRWKQRPASWSSFFLLKRKFANASCVSQWKNKTFTFNGNLSSYHQSDSDDTCWSGGQRRCLSGGKLRMCPHFQTAAEIIWKHVKMFCRVTFFHQETSGQRDKICLVKLEQWVCVCCRESEWIISVSYCDGTGVSAPVTVEEQWIRLSHYHLNTPYITAPCAFHWTLCTNDITSYSVSRLGVWWSGTPYLMTWNFWTMKLLTLRKETAVFFNASFHTHVQDFCPPESHYVCIFTMQ